MPHYGHFLLETMPRLWARSQEFLAVGARSPVIMHSGGANQTPLRHASYNKILQAADYEAEDVVICDQSIEVEELVVPWPLFTIRYSAHIQFADFMAKVGRRLAESPEGHTATRIYLSRRSLQDPSRVIACEDIIETIFRDAGFCIIHPEQLDIGQQVQLLEGARMVAGFAGSALHTLLFTQEPKRVLCFAREPRINANYILVDRVRNDDTTFVFLPDKLLQAEADGCFSEELIEEARKIIFSWVEEHQPSFF